MHAQLRGSEGTAQPEFVFQSTMTLHTGTHTHTPSAQRCVNVLTFSTRFRRTPPRARVRMIAINLRLKRADGRRARSKVCPDKAVATAIRLDGNSWARASFSGRKKREKTRLAVAQPHLGVRLCLILAHAADRDWKESRGRVVSSRSPEDSRLIPHRSNNGSYLRRRGNL